jgi:hypothetical protein
VTNLQRALKAYQWHLMTEPAEFAKLLGVSTLQYNRFVEDKPVDQQTPLRILAWLLEADVKPVQATLQPIEEGPGDDSQPQQG